MNEPERAHGTPTRSLAAGFTLLELMIVCGVLAVLFGLAVGFLGKTDPTLVADSILAGELRAAQWTARAEGLPTEVLVTPGPDGLAATVQSRLLEPIASFHFEPNEPVLDASLRGALAGRDVEQGRFGHGRANVEGQTAPVLRWVSPPSVIDLSQGFALRLDLRLDARGSCTLLRWGGIVELRLDADSKPEARLKLTGGTEAASNVATLKSRLALPLRQWCTLDVACDGRECWLAVDGRELGRSVADGQPQQDDRDTLDVALGDDPVPGTVDEVRVFAYSFGPVQRLPKELQPDRPYRIEFDARGEPVGSTAVKLLLPEERP
ncbi:MAG: prepilin-type N-terminal cleavage/methylation domain-containing protein [Planctomycetes bacterium]|nr:prepilin-type N-terminal cleavage/methylation domain-containing protein [Planctomycetota bacterium]